MEGEILLSISLAILAVFLVSGASVFLHYRLNAWVWVIAAVLAVAAGAIYVPATNNGVWVWWIAFTALVSGALTVPAQAMLRAMIGSRTQWGVAVVRAMAVMLLLFVGLLVASFLVNDSRDNAVVEGSETTKGTEYTTVVPYSEEPVIYGEDNGGVYAFSGRITDSVTGDPIEGAQVLASVQGDTSNRRASANIGTVPTRFLSTASSADPPESEVVDAYTGRDGNYRLDEGIDNLDVVAIEVNVPGYHRATYPISHVVGEHPVNFALFPDYLPAPYPASGSANFISPTGLNTSASLESRAFGELFIERLECNGIDHYTVDDIADVVGGVSLVGDFKTNALLKSSDCESVVLRRATYSGQKATKVVMKDGTVLFVRDGCANLIMKVPKEEPEPKPTPTPKRVPKVDIHGEKGIVFGKKVFNPADLDVFLTFSIKELGITTKTDDEGQFWFKGLDLFKDKSTRVVTLTICEIDLPKDMAPVDPKSKCKKIDIKRGEKEKDVGVWLNELLKIPPTEPPGCPECIPPVTPVATPTPYPPGVPTPTSVFGD